MRTFLYAILPFILLLCSQKSFEQTPVIEWQKCFGGGNGDYAHDIEQTPDGGYIIAGYSESPNGDITGPKGLYDIWVVKINNTGAIQWQKNFGGKGWDKDGVVIHQTDDGGYIIGASSNSIDGDLKNKTEYSMDFWMVKVNALGEIQWEKNYGGSKADYLHDMQITSDGGYIMAGTSESDDRDVTKNNGYRDVWVVKLARNGNIEWQKSFGGIELDAAQSIQQTTDGGYVLAGWTESVNNDVVGNHGRSDVWIIKLSSSGNSEWKKCYGGSLSDQAHVVRQAADGDYLIAGFTSSNDGDVVGNHTSVAVGFSDFWVIKLTTNGNIVWQKCLGGGFNELAYSLELTKDGGFVVAGSSESANGDVTCNAGWFDYWVVKCTSTGAIQWQKSMGGRSMEEIYSVKETAEGGIILAGVTGSSEIPGYHPNLASEAGDYWIIKLSAQLYSTAEPAITISIPSTNICAGSPYTFTASFVSPDASAIFQWMVNGVPVGTNNPKYTTNFIRAGDVVGCLMTVTTDCGTNTRQVESNSITMQGGQDITPEVVIAATATTICSGTAVTFTATNKSGNLNPSYQWTVNGQNVGTNSTEYTTSALTDGSLVQCRMTVPQCGGGSTKDDSDPIKITVKAQLNPSITITTASTTVCEKTAVSFTAKPVDGGTKPMYQWKVNGIQVGTNSADFATDALKDGDEVSCTLYADVVPGCSNQPTVHSNNIKMKVVQDKPATITINASENNVCEGTAVTFAAVTENEGPGASYQWLINGIKTSETSKTFQTNSFKNGDKVSCILFTKNVCAVSSDIHSNVVIMQMKQLPDVTIIPNDTTVMSGSVLNLQAIVSGNISSYRWLPEAYLELPWSMTQQTKPLKDSVVFIFEATAVNGCTIEKSVKISVINKLYMPNSFTPNGDGINDWFRIPPGTALELKEFVIFDRWGNIVFETKDIRKGWDGRFNNAIIPGTYVYMITGKDEKKEILTKGTVTLIK